MRMIAIFLRIFTGVTVATRRRYHEHRCPVRRFRCQVVHAGGRRRLRGALYRHRAGQPSSAALPKFDDGWRERACGNSPDVLAHAVGTGADRRRVTKTGHEPPGLAQALQRRARGASASAGARRRGPHASSPASVDELMRHSTRRPTRPLPTDRSVVDGLGAIMRVRRSSRSGSHHGVVPCRCRPDRINSVVSCGYRPGPAGSSLSVRVILQNGSPTACARNFMKGAEARNAPSSTSTNSGLQTWPSESGEPAAKFLRLISSMNG